MDIVNGYQYDKLKAHTSANGIWYYATADGKAFFLKKFMQPKYPLETASEDIFDFKKHECEEWLAAKKKLIAALDDLGNGMGNIISPREVFRHKQSFYQVTHWIEIQTDSLDKIKEYDYNDKVMLLNTYSSSLKRIHSKNIIHGDLKPENILIGRSASGNPVAKIIDFDDSYFSKKPLSPELTVVTDAYQSPELAAYKRGNVKYKQRLTCSSDVFASGIIFHQYWCGEMPRCQNSDKFVYEAIAAGEQYGLHKSLPDWLKELIEKMLSSLPEDRPTMEEVHAVIISKGNIEERAKVIMQTINFTLLDQALENVPKNLERFKDRTVKKLQKVLDKIEEGRESADQKTIDKYSKALTDALNGLKVDKNYVVELDFSKLDQILAAVPDNLTRFTDKSAEDLIRVVEFAKKSRELTEQADIDKLTKLLYVKFKSLVRR